MADLPTEALPQGDVIATVAGKFLECGALKHRYARVRCPNCHDELLVLRICRLRRMDHTTPSLRRDE